MILRPISLVYDAEKSTSIHVKRKAASFTWQVLGDLLPPMPSAAPSAGYTNPWERRWRGIARLSVDHIATDP